MKVLLVGKGAREHALAWKLGASPLLSRLWVWPGHAGFKAEPLDLPPDAPLAEVVEHAVKLGIDLVVVGPEGPLEAGLADQLAARGIPAFGPLARAAALESSKQFAKDVMKRAGIPTASYELATSEDQCRTAALALLARTGGAVLKASGLAAGKGVFVCTTAAEIAAGLKHLYHSDMKKAAATVVVEETLIGRECSYFSFLGQGGSTGIGFAVDFKRLEDQDLGPNTGGMGAYAPVQWLPPDAAEQVEARVVAPLIKTLAADGIAYTGCLYVGVMWGKDGPRVVEFNVRLGDPEAQILAVHDDRDWLALMAAKCGLPVPKDQLQRASVPLSMKPRTVGVVMASRGYPFGEGELPGVALPRDVFERASARVFGAAVTGAELPMQTGAGRVLTVVARAASFAAARDQAYAEVRRLAAPWPGVRYRTDIGARAAEEEA